MLAELLASLGIWGALIIFLVRVMLALHPEHASDFKDLSCGQVVEGALDGGNELVVLIEATVIAGIEVAPDVAALRGGWRER